MSDHTSDVLAVFLAQALLDGDLRFTEREQLFLCLRIWKPDLDRAEYRRRLSAIRSQIQDASSSAALLDFACQHAERLRPWIRPSRERSVRLITHLCQLAQVDGELSPIEVLCIQRVIEILGLQGRIDLSTDGGVAAVAVRKKKAS